MSAKDDIVIIGAAETDHLGNLPHLSTLSLHLEGARNALADAGMTPADIDGIATVQTPGPVSIAHALGVEAKWLDGTGVGGTSFLFHVRHAAGAIRAGLAETVLITHGESGRSRVDAPGWGRSPQSLNGQFEAPFGVFGPPTAFTLTALRYMKDTGTTVEQLAEVAVAQRRWANKNPRALMQDLVTGGDVLGAQMIAWPFTLLMCCLVTDGGGSLVVTTREKAEARGYDKPLVHLLGAGEAADSPMVSQMADLTSFGAFKRSSAAAFAEAGITHSDVDHLMIYDAFAHLPLYGLEDLGFCKPGEAAAFIREGNTRPGGKLPLNTPGGGLSYMHSGMYGMYALQESVRQMRGIAPAQVDGANISVCQGVGGMFAASGTIIFSNEAP